MTGNVVTPSGSDERRVLKAGRSRWVVLLSAGAGIAVVGVLIFFDVPGGRVAGTIVTVVFGACAAAGAVQLVFRSTLTLTSEGFAITGFGRPMIRRWKDIDSFVAVRPSMALGFVGIKLPASAGEVSAARRAAMAIGGYDGGALPDNYGMSEDDLAALLNDWLARHKNST